MIDLASTRGMYSSHIVVFWSKSIEMCGSGLELQKEFFRQKYGGIGIVIVVVGNKNQRNFR